LDVLPFLSILYAGQPASNAQELLAGDRFRALMNFCLREYDVTIVDTPPANSSSDARRIAGLIGYALIVASRDRTMVKDVQVLISQLQADRAAVVGTVMNRA
jgi:Mrp family chromosome partitioning ATPase